MKISICCLSATLLYISGIAQKKFTPGYITKSNQDTVHGYLQEEIKKDILDAVAFKNDLSATDASLFKPGEISGFGYSNGNSYKSISFKAINTDSSFFDKTCFAKQLVKGYYDLYVYTEGEEVYYVVFKSDSSQLLYDATYTAIGEVKRERNYLEKLRILSASCPDLSYRSDRIIYTEKEMGKFIIDVDHCMAPGKTVTSYYHKAKINTNLVVYAGGIPWGKQSLLTADLALRFSSPQVNKNLYLNIGVHYSNTYTVSSVLAPTNHPYELDTRHLVYSIPFTCQYNFTSGIIQPYVYGGLGVSYHDEIDYANAWTAETETKSWGLSIMGAVGIEAHITPKFFAKAEWRYEFLFDYLQLPSVGLAYKF